MSAVLFAPHADDEALFACYTVLRVRPRIVICYLSERDYGATDVRLEESRAAMRLCGVTEVEQWHGGDLVALMREYEAQHSPDEAWAPHAQASHPHHLEASKAAAEVFGERVRWYHTYDAGGKVRSGRLVRPRKGWADIKRQALACYQTQATHPRARVFYDEAVYELDEYAAAAPLQSSKKAV